MSGRGSSPSVLFQVAALAVVAVIASQAVAFALVLTAPAPRPAGFSVAAAADAVLGDRAETSDGRILRRRLSDRPGVSGPPDDPIERAIAAALAQRVGVPLNAVRVSLSHDAAHRALQGPGDPRGLPRVEARQSFVFTRRPGDPPVEAERRHREIITELGTRLRVDRSKTGDGDGPAGIRDIQIITSGERAERFTVLADRLTFAPFSASVRLANGQWATVEPPRGLIAPWQARLLASLAISLLILAPLVWLMARRLTRPIRVFADAAQRLGADPDAEPLTPSGPSEVRTAIGAFNDMQASLRDHMRRRTQTIAAIAHDLRTPLTRLRFRAEQAPDAVRDRMAADIEEMDALIAQAMAFVRGETPPDRREPLDLDALARACATGFSETGADVTFEGGATLTVTGDPATLRRAVANLIDNAVKFGGGARVRVFSADGCGVVLVEDDGPGLPLDEMESAFEPFHRGERSRSRETGGTGLGLAVARQAARGAGGEVTLSNRPGRGLDARLNLPLSPG